MLLRILKYWGSGLAIFLIIIFIIPETTNFVDTTLLIDMPYNKNLNPNIKNPIYLYNKNPIVLKNKIGAYLNNTNDKISIIVPRLEYIIYYFFLAEAFRGKNIRYELNSKNTKINPQLVVFYYHKTLISIGKSFYNYICYSIKNIKGKSNG